MVVTCQRCAAAFRVDPNKIDTGGSNVRCGKCGYVFFIQPEAPAPAPVAANKRPSAPPIHKEADVVSSLADQIFLFSGAPAEAPEPSPPEEEEPKPAPRPPRSSRTPTPLPKTPAPLSRVSPRARPPLPLRLTLAHGAVTALVALSGVLFGLLAMGVRPLPDEISLLLRYGTKIRPGSAQILSYQGRIQQVSPTERVFRLTGDLINRSGEDLPPPSLRLEMFAPNGEFLLKKEFPSGSERIENGAIRSFSTRIDLGQIPSIGSYKVTLER